MQYEVADTRCRGAPGFFVNGQPDFIRRKAGDFVEAQGGQTYYAVEYMFAHFASE